jgi:hypothetical protein
MDERHRRWIVDPSAGQLGEIDQEIVIDPAQFEIAGPHANPGRRPERLQRCGSHPRSLQPAPSIRRESFASGVASTGTGPAEGP